MRERNEVGREGGDEGRDWRERSRVERERVEEMGEETLM